MQLRLIDFIRVLALLMLTTSPLAAQVKIYPEVTSDGYSFWRNYEKANFYIRTDLQKTDSIKDILLNQSRSENDSARFYALVLAAEVDKINGSKEAYFEKVLLLKTFENKLKSYNEQFEIRKRLSDYYLYKRAFEKSDSLILMTLKNSKKTRDNKGISELYNLLATSKMQQNQKDSAMYYVNESIQFARRSAQKSIQASAFYTQAVIYNYFGQTELSVSKNLIALQLASEDNNIPKVAKYSLYLGESQLLILNYREAELYFKQTLENATKIRDKRLISLAQIQLGIIYAIEKNYQKSIDYQWKAVKTLATLNDFDGLGIAYNNLGDVYRELKDYPKALRNYNKALVYFESSGNREKIATVYNNVGIVFEKQGKHSNALNYLNRSVEIRSQFGFKGAIYGTYRAISEVYEKTKNYALSHYYLKLYADYADSSKTVESSAKVAELNELYRTEQRERLISLQSDSIQRQIQEKTLTATKLENVQLKNNMQTYIIIGFAILILLGGIIIFYRWNQTAIRQKQKEAEMNQTLLRTQMNPHFVFNAMSVIQSYIYDNDTNNSSKFLVNFSKLMRLILENSSKEFIPMEIEIDILDKYLNIQKLRFEDRFNFEIKTDPQLINEGAIIPPMITQPFIENAIEHGRLHLKPDGFINVTFYLEDDMLNIIIEDNGIGRKNAEQSKKGAAHKSMAMKITKDRIDNLNKKYRSEGKIIIEDYNKAEETGTKVLISIPYRVNTLN